MSNYRIMRELHRHLTPLLAGSRLWLSDAAIQHGDTTVLLHCLAVAYFSLKLVQWLHLKCDHRSLVRGALLHDYFLYDWHEPDKSHRLHGFYHPKRALTNAKEDVSLTPAEADIIAHHMFPLTPAPPRCREALVVCLVDKGCGLYETFWRNTYPGLRSVLRRKKRRAEALCFTAPNH